MTAIVPVTAIVVLGLLGLLAVMRLQVRSNLRLILEELARGRDDRTALTIRDTIELRTGTKIPDREMYSAMHALERVGAVSSREDDPTPERGGRPRVYYTLTPKGREKA